jgi:hypothetical protein
MKEKEQKKISLKKDDERKKKYTSAEPQVKLILISKTHILLLFI